MPLSVGKEVALTLYYVSDEWRMRNVANAFGIGKSTISKVVGLVTMAISRLLGPQDIKHPQTIEKVQEMATHFQERHGKPSSSRTLRCNPFARVNDLLQFWAASVHTMPQCFSCRH